VNPRSGVTPVRSGAVRALVLAAVFLWPGPILAVETEFSGFVETRHNLQVKSPNQTLASETLARLETTVYGENTTFFAAANLSENHLLGEASGICLHEGYLDWVLGNATLRTGRQIIIWGQSDGIRITDNISPLDYSETITRDFDEIRMGVDAVNLKYAGDLGDLQLIWIPVYRDGEMPSADSPWYLGGTGDRTLFSGSEPDDPFRDGEAAARYALYLPGGDLAFSYFYTWNDFPGYRPAMGEILEQVYDRVHILGAEFSKPLGEFVARAEAAWFIGSLVQGFDNDYFTAEKDRIKWLAGLDWYPGGQWTLSVQYSQHHILNHKESLTERDCQKTATFSLSKTLFREKLTLSAMAFFDVSVQDGLTRLSAEYEFMDSLSLFAGSDIFFGDREGNYGRYRDNTQVWTKIKYHF